jgi:hypothetical protein
MNSRKGSSPLKQGLVDFLKQFSPLAAVAILAGLVFILLSLTLEELVKPSSHWAIIALNFLSHLGIAWLILGIVGMLVDLPDWQRYFQERIKDTIIQNDFLKRLSPQELMHLTSNAMKAYFKVDDLDERESFLTYFQSRIMGFISNPYREDTHGTVHVWYCSTDNLFRIEDQTSYKCRRVGEYIQPEVKWSVEKDEIVGELEDFQIELRLPEDFSPTKECLVTHPEFSSNKKLTIKRGDQRLEEVEPNQSFILPLSALREADGLSISVSVKYIVPNSRFMSWYMAYPSKGFLFTIHYPRELELYKFIYGLNRSVVEENNRPGLYTLRCDSWLFLNDGVAFQLLKKSN